MGVSEGCASNVGQRCEPKEEPGPLVRISGEQMEGSRWVLSNGKIDQSVSGLVVAAQGWLGENRQGTGRGLGQHWRVFIPDLNKKGRGCSRTKKQLSV